MPVKTFGSAVYGVEAQNITVEVNISSGKPFYCIVGLPDNAVKESVLRIESALTKQQLKSKLFGLFFESDFNGIRVIHVPLKKYKSTFIRNYLY